MAILNNALKLVLSKDSLAEWLRRQTRNLME